MLRYGCHYHYADPQAISDASWFRANLPSSGSYESFIWYPSGETYNAATPLVSAAAGGMQVVHADQRSGGQGVSLGVFQLAAGEYNVVGISRWSSQPGYVIADAVKIVQR